MTQQAQALSDRSVKAKPELSPDKFSQTMLDLKDSEHSGFDSVELNAAAYKHMRSDNFNKYAVLIAFKFTGSHPGLMTLIDNCLKSRGENFYFVAKVYQELNDFEKMREYCFKEIEQRWVSRFSLQELDLILDRDEIREAIRAQMEGTRYESLIDLVNAFDDKILSEELADNLWTTVYKESAVDLYLKIGIGPQKAYELAMKSIFHHRGGNNISEPVRLLAALGMKEQIRQIADQVDSESKKREILAGMK